METIVPPVTTPGLTPGTDNGGVGGSLDVSGSGLEGLKPGISVNVSVQGGLDGLVASLKLNVNNRLFQIPVKLNLTANTQTLRLPENRPYPAEIKITASRPESLSFKFVTIDGQPPEKFVQTLRLPQQMPAAEKMPLINHTGSELKPEVQLHNLNLRALPRISRSSPVINFRPKRLQSCREEKSPPASAGYRPRRSFRHRKSGRFCKI